MFLSALACACGSDNAQPVDGSRKPTARFTPPSGAIAGEPALFDGSASSDPEGGELSFSWDFDDQRRGGSGKLAHVFVNPGRYRVVLTVRDEDGLQHSAQQTIEVQPREEAEGLAQFTVRVVDQQGKPLSDVNVEPSDSDAGTTDESGTAEVAVAAGEPTTLRLLKAGYLTRSQRLELPATQTEGYLELTLIERGEVQLLDADEGGELLGAHGAKLKLPPHALVDSAGKSVRGPVNVSLTPVDTKSRPFEFPGGIQAIDEQAEAVVLATYGVSDYSLEQDGEPLDLAPGVVAEIEIPLFAEKHVDGSAVDEGDEVALWSLDERTGLWIQEGVGEVVASDSPTGYALQAKVSHFSWWNCDVADDAGTLELECCEDEDGDWSPTEGCHPPPWPCRVRAWPCLYGCTGPVAPAQTSITEATDLPVFPGPLRVEAISPDATSFGSAEIEVAPNGRATLKLILSPNTAGPDDDDGSITLPYDANHALQTSFDVDTFEATLSGNSTLLRVRLDSDDFEGTVRVRAPDVDEQQTFGLGQVGEIEVTSPPNGVYQIEVASNGSAGTYHVFAEAVGGVTATCSAPQVAYSTKDTGLMSNPSLPRVVAAGNNPAFIHWNDFASDEPAFIAGAFFNAAGLLAPPETLLPNALVQSATMVNMGRGAAMSSAGDVILTGRVADATQQLLRRVFDPSSAEWSTAGAALPGIYESSLGFAADGVPLLIANPGAAMTLSRFDGGTWSEPVEIQGAVGSGPILALNADGVGALIWTSYPPYLRALAFDGQNFDGAVAELPIPSAYGTGAAPQAAADASGTVHVFINGDKDRNFYVTVAGNGNGSAKFGVPLDPAISYELPPDDQFVQQEQWLAVSPAGEVTLVSSEANDTYVRRKLGGDWGEVTVLGVPARTATLPVAVAENGSVGLLTGGPQSGAELYIQRALAGQTEWSAPERVHRLGGEYANIAGTDSGFVITWLEQDADPKPNDEFYKRILITTCD